MQLRPSAIEADKYTNVRLDALEKDWKKSLFWILNKRLPVFDPEKWETIKHQLPINEKHETYANYLNIQLDVCRAVLAILPPRKRKYSNPLDWWGLVLTDHLTMCVLEILNPPRLTIELKENLKFQSSYLKNEINPIDPYFANLSELYDTVILIAKNHRRGKKYQNLAKVWNEHEEIFDQWVKYVNEHGSATFSTPYGIFSRGKGWQTNKLFPQENPALRSGRGRKSK